MDPPPPPVDLLSYFPEHLQDEILRRLDLRDAIRTSALARAWRRRWETIPGLALTIPDGTPPSAVNRVLLRYAGPCVSRFATYVDGNDEACASHLADWLIALSRRGVESISMDNTYIGGPFFTVHSSIFACDRLVSLTLVECIIPPLPNPAGGFAGFPVLQDLHLASVHFADNGESQLPAIIRASPMLGILVLEGLDPSDMDGVIEAPRLHTLGLFDSMDWRFGELPCLRYGCFDIPLFFEREPAAFVEVLAVFSHVQELIITLEPFNFQMSATPFTFLNLKSLELLIDFSDMENILLMFFLLRSSPNIEKLKIQLRKPEMVADRKFLNAQWTDGMCANLHVVEITSVLGWLPLSFMELILSKAGLLRTLSVNKCPVSQDDPLNELLNCRRASPQAQVQFKDQLENIRFNHMKFAEKRLN